MVARRALPALCLAALLAITAQTTASADPTPLTLPNTLSVFPQQAGDTSLPGHFRYNVVAGSKVHDAEVVQNFTDHPLTVDIYPADLVQASGGAVAPTPKGTLLKGVGSWISVDTPTITLPAHTQQPVKFSVSVPVGITPANDAGAIVAEAVVGGQGQVNIAARVALIVEVDVPGTAHPSATIGTLSERSDSTPTAKTFGIDLTNTGNVLLIQSGAVVIRDSSGNVVDRLALTPNQGYAIPGGTLHLVSQSWTTPSLGKFTAQAEVSIAYNSPSGTVNAGSLPPSNTLSYTFLQWWVVAAAIAVLLVILLIIWRIWAKMRKSKRAKNAAREQAEREAESKRKAAERLRNL